jgi:hypothetical protein
VVVITICFSSAILYLLFFIPLFAISPYSISSHFGSRPHFFPHIFLSLLCFLSLIFFVTIALSSSPASCFYG